MQTIELRDLEGHLAEMLETAAGHEPFIVARDGEPWVTVRATRLPRTSGQPEPWRGPALQGLEARDDEAIFLKRSGFLRGDNAKDTDRRLGTLNGQAVLPDDFDGFAEDEILEVFGIKE